MAIVAATRTRVRTSDGLILALAKAAGYFLLSYLAATLLWILLPALALGWVPLVVASGSMGPTIERGDVVLIEPGVSPIPGHVVAFMGPGGIPVLHRLQQVNADGSFTTRGDANDEADSTPVTAIAGVGRLLVPGLGFVKLWLSEGAVALAVLGLAGFLTLSPKKWASVLAGGVFVGSALFAVSSTFTATTANAASSLSTVGISPPSNLAATCGSLAVGSDVPVSLTWTASPTVGVTRYEIVYDAAPPGGGFVVLGSTSATTFVHTIPNGQLALDQLHTYQVRAFVGPWSSVPSEDQVTISLVAAVYLCS